MPTSSTKRQRLSLQVGHGRQLSVGGMLVVVQPFIFLVMFVISVANAVDAWSTTGARAMADGVGAMGIAAFAVIVVPWIVVGWLVRWVAIGVSVAGAARIAWLHSPGAIWQSINAFSGGSRGLAAWIDDGGTVVVSLVFVAVALAAFVSARTGHRHVRSIEMASPFGAGTFGVFQGGGWLVNHHRRHREQRFALDCVRVRPVGLRTLRVVPRSLHDYLSFGTPLVSPVAGRVISTTDGLPDGGSRIPLAGNCVVVEPDGYPGWRMLMAHLRSGTVAVARGDRIAVGQLVGQVGSSGNSTEPHLHIHVQDEQGRGMPIRFAGRKRPLHRNDLLRAAPVGVADTGRCTAAGRVPGGNPQA